MSKFLKFIIGFVATTLLVATTVGFLTTLFPIKIYTDSQKTNNGTVQQNMMIQAPSTSSVQSVPADCKNWVSASSDKDDLTLLEILLAFLAIVGGAIYLWISKDIKDEIQKEWAREKNFINSKTNRAVGGIYFAIYHTYDHKVEKDKAKEHLDLAIGFSKTANEFTRNLERSEFKDKNILREYLVNKNNVSFGLSTKWEFFSAEMTQEEFIAYLERKENRKEADEYMADRKEAMDNISDIFKEDISQFDDLRIIFQQTKREVDVAFRFEPKLV